MILNGFREYTGGRFPVWREFRQILGKEFLVKKCSEFPSHANIICCHQMRVPNGCPRIHVPEAFLSNGHRSVQRVQQSGIAMAEGMSPSIQPQHL